jgi:hypothetical protein
MVCITGRCYLCKRDDSDVKSIDLLDHNGKVYDSVSEFVCSTCRREVEFVFVNRDGLLQLNRVERECTSTLVGHK